LAYPALKGKFVHGAQARTVFGQKGLEGKVRDRVDVFAPGHVVLKNENLIEGERNWTH
jgi:hypothetical protein